MGSERTEREYVAARERTNENASDFWERESFFSFKKSPKNHESDAETVLEALIMKGKTRSVCKTRTITAID